jgi:phage terminase small subunit
MPLTPKQERFVEEYLLDLNATQAAIRAGYSPRSADKIAYQLLEKTRVQEAIVAAIQARSKRTQVTADRIVQELAWLAFYDPGLIAAHNIKRPEDIATLPEGLRRVILGWRRDRFGNLVLKLAPKTPSLELLGRHLGMFKAAVDVSGYISIADLQEAADEFDAELARLAAAREPSQH